MTEFEKLLIENELSDSQAAELLGRSERTIRRWKTGAVDAPKFAITIISNLPIFNAAKAI